jgi:hypothetical protein
VGSGTLYANDQAAHWTPDAAQYRWLAADLAAHPGGLKFAFFHFPLHSDQASETTDPLLGGPNPKLEGFLADHGVQIAFNGHAHMYQRSKTSNGLISYLTGGGGGQLQSIGPCSAVDAYGIGWSDTRSTGNACGAAVRPTARSQVFHFLLVTVNGTSVTVAPTDSLGRTFDVQTYAFQAPPPATATAPAAPTGLSAQPANGQVSLSWTASTGANSYNVKRAMKTGGPYDTVGTPTATSFTDTTVTNGTQYFYVVSALNAAGQSPDSTEVSATPVAPPTAPVTLTFSPEADSYVDNVFPATNFGAASLLKVDTSPNVRNAFLRFSISGVTGTVQSAKLRVFAADPTVNGPQVFATSNAWTETGITWNNQPGAVAPASDDKAAIAINTVVEFDVRALVAAGNGTYSFVLIPQSSDGFDMASREASAVANRPQLVLTVVQ